MDGTAETTELYCLIIPELKVQDRGTSRLVSMRRLSWAC